MNTNETLLYDYNGDDMCLCVSNLKFLKNTKRQPKKLIWSVHQKKKNIYSKGMNKFVMRHSQFQCTVGKIRDTSAAELLFFINMQIYLVRCFKNQIRSQLFYRRYLWWVRGIVYSTWVQSTEYINKSPTYPLLCKNMW